MKPLLFEVREPPDPSLGDERWRTFVLAVEENSGFAKDEWPPYLAGIRRLKARFARVVPALPLRRALAEDRFFCATHWRHARRVVQAALRELLRHPIGPTKYAFAAAELWSWSCEVSPASLGAALAMLARARTLLPKMTPLARRNVERTFAVVVGPEAMT